MTKAIDIWPGSTFSEQEEFILKLSAVFLPHNRMRRAKAIENGGRFVHYTTAENALKIIESKRVWLRNTNCMNDYSEVQHGHESLNTFFKHSGNRSAFCDALDRCHDGVAEEALQLYDDWLKDTKLNTYVACVSEHRASEDSHGRLSMWRGFAHSTTGVALVIKLPIAPLTAHTLGIVLSPAFYWTQDELSVEMHQAITNMRMQNDFIKSIDRQLLVNSVFQMLTNIAVCLKHPVFQEELEWRIIYYPRKTILPPMKYATKCIRGVPQRIYELPLDGGKEGELKDISIEPILDRIIIGATQYTWPVFQSFSDALTTAGMPLEKVPICLSQIPIRT